MVAPGQALGKAGCLARAVPVFVDPRFFWATLALVGTLLFAALVIWLVDRWRKRSPRVPSSGDQLTHFRRLYEQGEISAEEFARIRGLLTERLIQELAAPSPSSEPAAPPPPRPNGPAS
jgi:hypothetical protein